ncbi:E3 ubiquitin-protein ligase BRE1A-like [Saccostrea cucullata]|uniref:E3 ubiquitin-protein ligase BRE1A-like n=1 Tax=Saccostrea cuccullata TaxID=36930 RepID=UPI002ECFB319
MAEESKSLSHAINQVCNTKFVFGSFHQGDARFSSFSRGSQCTCNALTILIKSYEGFSFSTEFIDSTLIAGDQVYVMLVKNLQQRQMFLNKLLKLDELPSNLTLGENHHVIEKFETMWGLLVSEEQISQVKSLHQALEEAFQVSRYLLIMIGAICSGVYKVSDKEYYFFDSHSHDSAGMSSCDGKSVLVQSTGIDDLVSYLYSMYNSMHIDFAMQFEILPISIKTLHHSFPEKSPLQKKFYKMDDHLSSVTNPDQNPYRKRYMREYMRRKRQNVQFKQVERNKETHAKKLRRQNDDIKSRETETATFARKLKRQNAEIRQKEKERDAAARKLKRQDAEIKEKEREMDKFARKSKRQDTEIKEKERKMNTAGRKLKRQDAEIKEKEREMDKFARKSKRQDTQIKEKERKMNTAGRKLKRQDAEIKEKERKMNTTGRQLKRQDAEIKEKEKKMNTAGRKLKRQDTDIKEKERKMNTAGRKLKRQDAEIKEKERQMDKLARKSKRQDAEIKQKEREMDKLARKSKRQDAEIKEKEREMNTAGRKLKRQNVKVQEKEKEGSRISKRKCRENPIVLERERLKKQAKRSNISFRENERLLNREQKQRQRADKEYCEKVDEQQRRKKFGIDIEDCIQNFHEQIKHGPIFVCSCCQQTWFKESVSKVENIKLNDECKSKFLTSTVSVENVEWICNTCCSSIRQKKIPKLSVFNGMMWPLKPMELDLFSLEERLVSLRIPFMQIRELPRGGQYSVRGNIVNVPVDIQPTVNSLPRKLDENVTVPVKLKKKLSYQKCDYHENVRPTKVLIALHWLMNNSDFYKNANINVDENWFQEITTSASEMVQELVRTQTRSNQNTDDDERLMMMMNSVK